MKRVTNTHREPIVISLLVKTPGKIEPDRTHEQLLVGKYTDVEDDAISPELRLMEKKERVSIEDIDVLPTMEPPGTVEVEVIEEETPPKPVEEMNPEELEHELLQEHDDPQEG